MRENFFFLLHDRIIVQSCFCVFVCVWLFSCDIQEYLASEYFEPVFRHTFWNSALFYITFTFKHLHWDHVCFPYLNDMTCIGFIFINSLQNYTPVQWPCHVFGTTYSTLLKYEDPTGVKNQLHFLISLKISPSSLYTFTFGKKKKN